MPWNVSHWQAAVLWGSLSCCTTWHLNVSRRGSATPQPRVVHVVVAAQSPADCGRATYATPLAAVGEVCPSLLPARFAMTPLISVLHPERTCRGRRSGGTARTGGASRGARPRWRWLAGSGWPGRARLPIPRAGRRRPGRPPPPDGRQLLYSLRDRDWPRVLSAYLSGHGSVINGNALS